MFKTSDLFRTLDSLIEVCDNILISGAPGIGKSEIVYQVCSQKGLSIYEVRLYEQGESAIGFPRVDSEVTKFTKPFWFERIERERPDVVLFDDFHLVEGFIQRYFYRFLTSRMIHDFGLSYTPKLIVAGNFKIETASACELQSPVCTRFDVMIEYEPDVESFERWAAETGRIDEKLLAFIRANPDSLYTPDPPSTGMYPCPRTWEKLTRLLRATGDINLATGVVGVETGSRLIDFWPFLGLELEEIIVLEPKSLEPAKAVACAYLVGTKVGPAIVKGELGEMVKRAVEWVNAFDADIALLFCRACLARLGKDELPSAKRAFVENLRALSGVRDDGLYAKVLKAAVVLAEGPGERAEEAYRAAMAGVAK